MSIFNITQFTGGMNDWLDPTLLDEKSAELLVDADISDGKISPVNHPGRLFTNDLTDFGHYGNKNRSAVKWYSRNYWSENEAYSPPYYGGDVENLGVPYPENHPVVTTASGSLTGAYRYCWCYVNENGWESAPCAENGDLWVDVTLTSQNAVITAPATFPDGISYIKVYRTADKGADFYCVGEITVAGSTFTDSMSDADLLTQEAANTFHNYPPPEGGKYLTESGGVFFLAVRDKVYFSVQNNPHAWPTLNYLGFDDVVTGITAEFQGVLVFTTNNTFRIIGASDAATVMKTLIPGNQGCVNYRTISHLSNAPVWLSNDGICLWDGENLTMPSQKVLKTEKLDVKYAVSANDVYYLFLKNGTIVYDLRNGGIFRKLSFTADYAWYYSDRDKLYLEIDGELYEYGTGEVGTFKYRSPAIGGSSLTMKTYYEIVFSCSDSIKVIGEVDDIVAFELNVSYGGRKRVKLPFGTVGRNMQVQIESSGKLTELAVLFGG